MSTRPNPNVPAIPAPAPGQPPVVVDPHQLDAATPVLFLPVNIETRFMDSDGPPELWVRIYPDQIAINSHEPELTDQEIADGTTYWDAVWRAGNPPPSLDAVKAPWRGLGFTLWIAARSLDCPDHDAHEPCAPARPAHARRNRSQSKTGLSHTAHAPQFVEQTGNC